MTESPKKLRLSEQDMAQLYMQTEAALRLDALLQGQEEENTAQIAVHDAIGGQTPDLALISLSLCALIIARDFPLELKDGEMGPVIRELVVSAEDNLVTVGHLWLDTSCYGIAPDMKQARPIILSIPDRLRIMASIMMELRDALEGGNEAMYRAVKTLYYQAESHADLADKFVEPLAAKKKKSAEAKAKPAAVAKPAKKPLDQVPLPFELTRPKVGADIVTFSLFREKRGR
ncbi:MAG: hypothetical protein KGQ41_05095 [Alphaproteobacteria bacterium]|nr:hypothetical protein [Alphaproteobacteria bacterium]